MRDLLSLRCANCGSALALPGDGASGVTCPVCQFFNPVIESPTEPEITLETLETRLSDLVAQARASDIPLDAITHVLRDELEFAAELASGGRDLCVQIIDLGPRVSRQPQRRSSRDDNVMLRGRAVGG
jgi:phage FluMu protein Com